MNFQVEYHPTQDLVSTGSALVEVLRCAQECAGKLAIRNAINRLEAEMAKLPQVEQPVKHHFANGLYGREIFNPADSIIVTKEHKAENISFLLSGTMSVITEDGMKILTGPMVFVTKPGTKRVIYSQTDCLFATVHPNPSNSDNLNVLEAGIIAGGFDEVGATTLPTLEAAPCLGLQLPSAVAPL